MGSDHRREIEISLDRLLVAAPALVVLALLLYLTFASFYTVDPHEQAVVLRFGRFQSTTTPGLHFRIPFVDTVWKVSVEEHGLRLPFGQTGGRPNQDSEASTLMLTGDLNAAAVEWTVQWKVTVPEDYLFSFQDPGGDQEEFMQQIITTAANTVMNRLVGDYSIDEVLTDKRGEIAATAREATQQILDQYNCGVVINDLQMQRVTPPERVKPAFDEVNSSIQKRDQLENEANKERNQLLPAAYAKKDQLIREAEGYASRRRAEATGEVSALLAKYHAYQRSPDVTRQRLYLESMQNVLGQVDSMTIIDDDLNKLLPLLDLGKEGK